MEIMKGKIGALVGLILILLCIFYIERDPRFFSSKQIVHNQSVPPEFLVFGTLGKVMKQLNVVYAVPRDFSLFPSSQSSRSATRLTLKQQSPLLEKYQFRANPGRVQSLPSSLVISESDFKDGWPSLSIVMDEENLYDPEKGILTHKLKRGQDWERLGYVSYYEDGNLVFGSGVGVRLHGGNTARRWELRRPGFRLYLRNVYGLNQIEPGILYSIESKPIKHLVIVEDTPKYAPFINCVAYEISRHIGAIVPDSKPILFFLNGEFVGTYAVVEHVHRRQWEYHIGHSNFAFFNPQGKSDKRSEDLYSNFKRWARDLNREMTFKEAGKRVDLDNLSRQIISIVFLGTTDWRQGAAVLDLSESDAKWFWINWDMNHSILDCRKEWGWLEGITRESWEQEGFELILAGKKWYVRNARVRSMRIWDVRSILFARLIKESPEYCKYFVRLIMDILNHRLTADFFQPLVERYKRLAISYGFERETYTRIEKFVQNRPIFLRKQIQQYFDEGECFLCEMDGPHGIQYEIDGYAEKAGYRGWYFKGKKMTVKILVHPRGFFSHWEVNGKKIVDTDLVLRINTKTKIKPIFKMED
jgi:hypothetical protein